MRNQAGFAGFRVQFVADDGRMRRLPVLPVGAGGLAERRYIAEQVEKVVLNLKCQADGGGESGERLVTGLRQIGCARGRHQHARADDGAGLARMHILDGRDIELLALNLQIDRLSAGHTKGAAGLAQQVDQTR